MTAPDSRLGEPTVEEAAILKAARALRDLYAEEVCKLPVSSFTKEARTALEAAHPILLAELRKRDEALDGLMRELVAREERWRLAYVAGDLTHEEASQIALEDRWAYAQLADIRGHAAVAAATGGKA